jgi:hypothetical protein
LQTPLYRNRVCVLGIRWAVGLLEGEPFARRNIPHKSLDPPGRLPHGGFPFGNTSKGVVEVSNRRMNADMLFAIRTLLTSAFGERCSVDYKSVG